MNLYRTDHKIIHWLRKASLPTARVSLFIVYGWFGILKVFGMSPATELVHHLFNQTIPVISFDTFYLLFALFEVLIGIMFLFPKTIRIVIPLLLVHMITTFLPLILLPGETWSAFLVPTMAGQYILKNLVIIALGIGVAAHAHPLPQHR